MYLNKLFLINDMLMFMNEFPLFKSDFLINEAMDVHEKISDIKNQIFFNRPK